MNKTQQEKFWSSNFGKDYIKRNYFSPDKLNSLYIKNYGISRSKINKNLLGKIKTNNVLEVGCNIGSQLVMLQSQGFKNLYGIEIYDKAVELSKKLTKNINIIQGSGFDIPFKDNYFDLVFTSGVLIHINPKDLKRIMAEIYRVSKKYIWGFEYFNSTHIAVPYRGYKNRLWKGDFMNLYREMFPDLKLVKETKYKYLGNDNIDASFLLKKDASE